MEPCTYLTSCNWYPCGLLGRGGARRRWGWCKCTSGSARLVPTLYLHCAELTTALPSPLLISHDDADDGRWVKSAYLLKKGCACVQKLVDCTKKKCIHCSAQYLSLAQPSASMSPLEGHTERNAVLELKEIPQQWTRAPTIPELWSCWLWLMELQQHLQDTTLRKTGIAHESYGHLGSFRGGSPLLLG